MRISFTNAHLDCKQVAVDILTSGVLLEIVRRLVVPDIVEPEAQDMEVAGPLNTLVEQLINIIRELTTVQNNVRPR